MTEADLTPRQIVEELDRYIVGQADAKRAVAIAIRNRWRRRQLDEDVARDIAPKNIIMAGPTGVGKTEIARRLATLVRAPFVKVEATKFTEVGYYGRDVESMVRDLVGSAIDVVRDEFTHGVREQAEAGVEDRILDALLPSPSGIDSDDEARAKRQRTRETFRKKLAAGEMDDTEVEIKLERKASMPSMGEQMGGMGSLGIDMSSMFESMMPTKKEAKRLTVREARRALFQQEADKLIDEEKIKSAAVERAEQSGIIFLDEIDKIASGGEGSQRTADVSRQGVQRDLLPIVEGSTVTTKHGPVKTDHILFIAAGAFHSAKVGDLMPELQGRFPIRVELADLTKEDFVRILTEPKNALTTQQIQLMSTEGVTVQFDNAAIELVAQTAFEVNRRQQNIGARRLYTILERVFEELAFEAPAMKGQTVTIDEAFVRSRVKGIIEDEDLSAFVL